MGGLWGYFSLFKKKHFFILKARILVCYIQAAEEALRTGPTDINFS